MTCEKARHSLGAYAIGSLEPDERQAVANHLTDCPRCATELAEIDALPALLGRLSIEDVESPRTPLPPEMFERLAVAARADEAERSRRTFIHRLLAAAAAVVVLAGAGVGILETTSSRGGPSYTAVAGRIHIAVAVAAQSDGTDLRVSVSGLPENEHCQLLAVSRDGRRDDAGSWVATYAGKAQVTGSTTIPRAQLAQLQLLGTHGEQLVGVPLSQ